MKAHIEQRCRPGKDGFTVAEVFMVLLLLAAVTALVLANFFSFEGALEKRPARDQLRLAVAEGHRLARTHKQDVILRYDADAAALVLSDPLGKELARRNFPPGTEAEVHFYRILPESQFEEEPSFELEEDPVEQLRFMSYGASVPFVIEFNLGDASEHLRFDAFSSMNTPQEIML
jgi:hypothetical protein